MLTPVLHRGAPRARRPALARRAVALAVAVAVAATLAVTPGRAQERLEIVMGELTPQPDHYVRSTVLKPGIPIEADALVPGLAVRVHPVVWEVRGHGCEQCHRLAAPVPTGPELAPDVFARLGPVPAAREPAPTGFTRLSDAPSRDEAPRWSPDGTRVLVEATESMGTTRLVSILTDGGAPTTLTDHGTTGWANWSPDGRSIVAWRAGVEPGSSSLWLLDADGDRARRITTEQAAAFPVFSPDGRAIAYGARAARGPWTLRLLTLADGTSRTVAGPGFDLPSRPQFSPDGRDIAFQALADDGFGLWRARYPVGPDGAPAYQEAPRLVPTWSLLPLDLGQAPASTTWSPDGRRIAVQMPAPDVAPGGERIATYKTWLMDPNGEHPRLLVPSGTLAERSPSWSPTGNWLAQWAWGDDLRAAVWLVRPDGGVAVNVTAALGGDALEPAWSPDGTRLAFASNRAGSFDIWIVDLRVAVPGFEP